MPCQGEAWVVKEKREAADEAPSIFSKRGRVLETHLKKSKPISKGRGLSGASLRKQPIDSRHLQPSNQARDHKRPIP